MEYITVLVTAKDESEAEKIARVILDKKLAACCNIVRGVRSMYWWEGKICDDVEVLCVIKTRENLFPMLEAEIKKCHSYSVPEIIALPIVAGSEAYLKWLGESLKK